MPQRVFLGDFAAPVRIIQGLIEGDHAVLCRTLHQLLELVDLALKDQIGNQRRVEHDLHDGPPAIAVGAPDQLLRDDAAQVERQVHQNLIVLLLGEEMQDAIERLVGIVGVQRGQHQVTGFGKGDRVLHRLARADLTDQNHIRRLAQRVFQRHLVRLGIQTHLALSDDATGMIVQKLDRVLDTDDMAGAVLVAVTDHRRQRRRLTRARGADKEDDTAVRHRQIMQVMRQPKLLESGDTRLDASEHHAHRVALHKGAHTETPDILGTESEVAFLGMQELVALLGCHQRQGQLARLRRIQLGLRDRHDTPMHLDARRDIGGDEKVRCLLLDHHVQDIVKVHAMPSKQRCANLAPHAAQGSGISP